MTRSSSVFVWVLWAVVILFAASAYAIAGLAVLPPLVLGVVSVVLFVAIVAASRYTLV